MLLLFFAIAISARAQETVCASVKIQIKQQLTLERQAFDAEMKINNTTDSGVISDVSVVVKVMEENGTPVSVTEDPNASGAKFFIRISNKQNISDVTGTGTISPATSAVINWLIIPAPGSAGLNPAGKKYLVGATLKYRYAGEDQTLEVSPDVVTVKPLPLLTLDYFLPREVEGDDPLTAEVEPVVPFTLGVRVKNNGQAAARNLKIDSAQPKIIENKQGLLINFQLTGSYVNDAPTQNSLLINFGDIAASTSKTGRWIMETSLSGKFTEFNATFSHADELGGAVTSILQATNAHFLIRDVRVDLPGRDTVRDFLAVDGDYIRVYESDGLDTLVTDRSAVAQLRAGTNSQGAATYKLTMPPTDGFVYAKMRDPFNGTKAIGTVVRSDAKQILPENVWLSRSRNPDTKQWEYFVNFFDVNTTGVYESDFQAPPKVALPPVIQFIPDRVTKVGQAVSFLVEASSPQGTPVTLSASPLPTGATFTPQATNPQSPTVARASFSWTPGSGSAGNYLINYTATDGTLSASRAAGIKVETDAPPPGPGTPTIESPASGAQVTVLRPTLQVMASADAKDPTTKVQFEVYADEAMTQQVASVLVDKAPLASGNGSGAVAQPTRWSLGADLSDNTKYWWRARAFNGTTIYSPWVNGRFFVNTVNDPPDNFNLTNPVPGSDVTTLTPTLSWTNSFDKDGDAITYSVFVYKDATLKNAVAQVADLPEATGGITSWTVPTTLSNHGRYYWRVIAKDALGAVTPTPARMFVVNTGNLAPSPPAIMLPPVGGQSASLATALTVMNSVDPENDLITYVFEIDTANTFDSADKRTSGQVMQNTSGSTAWVTPPLVENKMYWWRVKAQDGHAESAWVVGSFLMNAVNDPPPVPTIKNPGNGAWAGTQQPSLEVNPVVDPEGEAVRYEFEVFRDARLTRRVASGTSNNTALIVGTALEDKVTHWWRARSIDASGATSAWSTSALLHVSTGPYQNPSIALIAPATPSVPEIVNVVGVRRKQITLRWEGVDPNIEPTVALYYGTSASGYAGNLIVDGLRQNSGTQSGSYVWDVTSLSSGTYYVYAVIYDARGMGRAYAPGTVLIPPADQSGSIVVTSESTLYTREQRESAAYKVRLGKAPTSEVTVPIILSNPREGETTPAKLLFTPSNWAVDQTVTVRSRYDCMPDGSKIYQIIHGGALSNDPNYIGLSGKTVNVFSADNTDEIWSTDNPRFHLCGLTMVSEKKLDSRTWEYTLRGDLSNSGVAVSGVTAKLKSMPLTSVFELIEDTLVFGAIGAGESAKTLDTITVRARVRIAPEFFKLGFWSLWTVKVQP
ncbi:hypothetical protein [Variovorax sp. 350MFTsu5.1]|uniref:hypothetical protein n=1 Tax=Variovorax sp. 350MFTsu5.1 TaxID=3158365 RepID=UPI003AB0F287